MTSLRILNALTELYAADEETLFRWRQATIDYRKQEGIDLNRIAGHCGPLTVCPITLLPNKRFDIPEPDNDTVEGCVIEARAADGGTIIDLVAWPIVDPPDVRTLSGAAPIVGLSATDNPATYTFGAPLLVHRTPLDWLKAGCNGAAVIVPEFAARLFLDIANMGGRIGATDASHANELRQMLQGMVSRVEIVFPKLVRRAA